MDICKIYTSGGSSVVNVPIKYRRKLGWKKGDLLYCELTDDGILFRRIEAPKVRLSSVNKLTNRSAVLKQASFD